MASNPRVFRSEVFEVGTKRPRARIVDLEGDLLAQGDFSGSVTLKVFDLSSSTPTTAVLDTTRTIANVVFNSQQTWTLDTEGFNFGDTITSNEVSWEGGHTYRICYLLTHTTDGLYPVIFEVRVRDLLSS